MKTGKIIENVNRIIRHAVTHGGDAGGSYDQNEEGLLNSIYSFMDAIGLNKDEYEVIECYHLKDKVFSAYQIINIESKKLGLYDDEYDFY